METSELVGKVVLVGISFYYKKRTFLEDYQTHGTIDKIVDGLMILSRPQGKFQLPYEGCELQKAKEGRYTEKSTGVLIENPDYLGSLHIMVRDVGEIAHCKTVGYQPKKE